MQFNDSSTGCSIGFLSKTHTCCPSPGAHDVCGQFHFLEAPEDGDICRGDSEAGVENDDNRVEDIEPLLPEVLELWLIERAHAGDVVAHEGVILWVGLRVSLHGLRGLRHADGGLRRRRACEAHNWHC